MRRGFTLIELLAVIVILAIIALIATPIVLNIIEETKESATLRSIEYYLTAVEHSIMKKSMNEGGSFSPNSCVVQSNGNLLCDGADELEIEVNGEKPSSGTITFEKGKITNVELTLGNKIVTKNEEGEFILKGDNLENDILFPELNHSGIIPEGGTYTAADGTVYHVGEAFPATVQVGDTYAYGDYEYYYDRDDTDGWAVRCINNVAYPGAILEYINGEAITSLMGTFSETRITTAPAIPNSVTHMTETFLMCESLVTAPTIPNSVTHMEATFAGCTSLTGTITINANPIEFPACFDGTERPIFLTGSSTVLADIAATAQNNNVSQYGAAVMFDPNKTAVTLEELGGISPIDGDRFFYGDYMYLYRNDIDGWQVAVPDKTKTEYGIILTDVGNKPIVSLEYAFSNCTSLVTAPAIPSSVTNMKSTFAGCTSLVTAPAIPSSVNSLPWTFSDCTSLVTAPVISNGVTNIDYTFDGCSSLVNVPAIPSSVTSMQGTFYGCTSLVTAPAIPSSVTNMDATFHTCTSLVTAPAIPSSVTSMQGTFLSCKSLVTAPVIPSTVTDLKSTFRLCTSLTGTITVNANPSSYGDCFYGTTQPIVLTGSSTVLADIAATGEGNVTVQ